ncbi:MAG: NTP transferase domain-containing protein [Caldithrix sp.]|nr:NTP transferase domain-containing protein [Caldithrix sp.]
MKAMILAAGLGSRLQPLTNSKPKALIEINGRPLLQIVIERLKYFGFNEIIINVHHFKQQIIDFIDHKKKFNIRIEFSREKTLLDTGGGVQKASWFFDDDKPFLLHNVDILTDVDYRKLIKDFEETNPLALLAVNARSTHRFLLFDQGTLCGWENVETGERILLRKDINRANRAAFMGIHFISPQIFRYFPEEQQAFSILETYLQAAEKGAVIRRMNFNNHTWIDVGKKESLEQAETVLEKLGI